jgi:hypothetical protein
VEPGYLRRIWNSKGCRERAASRRFASLPGAAVLCALLLAVTVAARPARPTPTLVDTPGAYTVMQMNLCLSGLAGCYGRVAYPAVVDEAVRRIGQSEPDAVTFNEACRGDVARIARRAGYNFRFSRVIYFGARLHCVDPSGRGLFGDAVLTKAAVEDSESRDFRSQSDIERRRWLCVATRARVDVCTAHLSTRNTAVTAATNDDQCAELRRLLANRADTGAVVFGGDVNRRPSCAPVGFWSRTDGNGTQSRGLQHVYASRGSLRRPMVQVVRARHSDHDVLLVSARRVPPQRPSRAPSPSPSTPAVHRMPPDGRGTATGPRE